MSKKIKVEITEGQVRIEGRPDDIGTVGYGGCRYVEFYRKVEHGSVPHERIVAARFKYHTKRQSERFVRDVVRAFYNPALSNDQIVDAIEAALAPEEMTPLGLWEQVTGKDGVVLLQGAKFAREAKAAWERYDAERAGAKPAHIPAGA